MQRNSLGPPIAVGRTAELFPWGEGHVLKLFHPWVPLSDIALERNNSVAARALGVAAPAVLDIVQHANRYGLVFERVEGPTLLERLLAEPQALEQWAHQFAELHLALHRIHHAVFSTPNSPEDTLEDPLEDPLEDSLEHPRNDSHGHDRVDCRESLDESPDGSLDDSLGASRGTSLDDSIDKSVVTSLRGSSGAPRAAPPTRDLANQPLPDQHRKLAHKIRHARQLTPQERAAVLDLLLGLPKGNVLCHGDFHPGNIIMTANQPVIIDWVDGTIGNPIADVARSSIVLLGHIESGGVDEDLKAMVKSFHQLYLQHYMAAVSNRRHEYEQWLVVCAAARLSEGVEGQEQWLLHWVRKWLLR